MITHYFTPWYYSNKKHSYAFSISKSAQDEIWTVKRHAIKNIYTIHSGLTKILSGWKLFRILLFMVKKISKQLKNSYLRAKEYTITKCIQVEFEWKKLLHYTSKY